MLARLAFFLLLIVPPIALAADAPPSAGKITVVQPPPKPAAVAAAPTPAPPPRPAASPAPRGGADCRMDCAQSYYQCRADDTDNSCGGSWSQCLAACNSPNLAPAFSTAP